MILTPFTTRYRAGSARALILTLLSLAGCMDRNADDLLTPVMPSITLRWPRSGDVVMTGHREILYEFESPRGAATYELVVNDSLLGSYPAGTDGALPDIYWQVDTALIPTGARYFLRVYDHDGNAATSTTMTGIRVITPTSPPAPPAHLALWVLSASAVNFTWEDASNDESGFELWRSAAGSAFARIQSLPPNAISTNDTGLAGGVVYRYRVRAVNAFGFGESNEVSVGSPNPVLDAPTSLAATARGTRLVELQWSDNSSGELGFVIQRRVSTGSVFSQVGLVGPNAQAFADTAGLSGGSSYTYRVAARGQFGQSAWSNEETVTTLYQDVFPPSNLIALYESASKSVRLTWKDNTIFEIQTRIERRSNPTGLFAEIARTGVDVVSYRDTTATAGVSYTYRVRAATAGEYLTVYSNEASVTLPGSVPPSRPAGNAAPEGSRIAPVSRHQLR
jgi:titin